MLIALRIAAFVVGVFIVQAILRSAVRTVVVPQGEQTRLMDKCLLVTHAIYGFSAKRKKTLEDHSRVMARFAPTALLLLATMWVVSVVGAFVLLFWAVNLHTLEDCIYLSGSSISTLGVLEPRSPAEFALSFIEAMIGLAIVALLISYLPTIYSLFAQREAEVVKLDVRAGSPPTALEMLNRFHRINWLDHLGDTWEVWEEWFAALEESHTTHAVLVFFRSQRVYSSWITAAGALLDSAAVTIAALDVDQGPQAFVTLRSGFLSLRRIAQNFDLPIDFDPEPNAPISIYREEFMLLLDELEASGVPLKSDREAAWRAFAGWRVNYDQCLLALCALVDAPPTPWSSDRSMRFHPPTVFRSKWRIEEMDNPPSW